MIIMILEAGVGASNVQTQLASCQGLTGKLGIDDLTPRGAATALGAVTAHRQGAATAHRQGAATAQTRAAIAHRQGAATAHRQGAATAQNKSCDSS